MPERFLPVWPKVLSFLTLEKGQLWGHDGENELLSWKLTTHSAFLSLSARQEPRIEAGDAAKLKIRTCPHSPQPAGSWEGLCPSLGSPTHRLPWLWAETGSSPGAKHWEVVPALLLCPSSSLPYSWVGVPGSQPGPSQGKCRIQLC